MCYENGLILLHDPLLGDIHQPSQENDMDPIIADMRKQIIDLHEKLDSQVRAEDVGNMMKPLTKLFNVYRQEFLELKRRIKRLEEIVGVAKLEALKEKK